MSSRSTERIESRFCACSSSVNSTNILEIKIFNWRIVKIAQWLKCLLHKHEDLNLDSQNPPNSRNSAGVLATYNPRTQEMGMFGTSWLTGVAELQIP